MHRQLRALQISKMQIAKLIKQQMLILQRLSEFKTDCKDDIG